MGLRAAVMGSARGRPIPAVEPHTTAYWEGAAHHELRIQRCASCQFWIHPPRHACPRCLAEHPPAVVASGLGSVYSFAIAHTPGGPGFENVPYAVAVIELDEQPGLLTVGNVTDTDPHDLEIGQRVAVHFEPVDDGIVLPQWHRR